MASWDLTPHMREQAFSLRAFAREVISTLDRYGGNLAPAYDEVMPLVDRILRQADLTELGVRREGNHTPGSQWLYYDYELEIHLSTFTPGLPVPVHDHGTWEFIAPYAGEFTYTRFRRLDDRSLDGHAELEVVEQRVLRPGDGAVCGPPPDDIHTFTPVSEDVLLLGMNHGPLAPRRTYYDVDSHTCTVRDSKAWRLGLAPAAHHPAGDAPP
jgi:predicted metal-dependent enzyme (double-stranded beta helix superfamily)